MRPGIQGLMRDAATGQCALVLSESLDRFSRDLEDTAALSKRLKFEDVRLVTISEGDVSTLQVGFKGTMNALFLQDLADKTRRGLRGRVEDGRSAGESATATVWFALQTERPVAIGKSSRKKHESSSDRKTGNA